MAGACGTYRRQESFMQVLVKRHMGKRPIGRSRDRRKDNIKMDLQGVACGSMDWFELAYDKDWWQVLVNAELNFWIPLNVGNFLTD
jgi:hypothetical protein